MSHTSTRPETPGVISPTGAPRLRYAPSPTGFQHLGGFRTALFDWLYARHTGGQFILRIEDTDTTRTIEGAVEDFLAGLAWLGLDIDEGPSIGGPFGPYQQTQRKALYQQYAAQLIESGHAYRCYCTPERIAALREEQQAQKLPPRYDRRCRNLSAVDREANEAAGLPSVVRLATPLEGETVVPDQLHGDMVFQNVNLDDIIVLKSNGLAPYHLAAMVDDHLMGITHILRGEEWISTSPYHVLIFRFLKWTAPYFYHLPNVLGKDKKKLSKRKGAPTWRDVRDQGYLPEAVLNFMALIGWSYDDKTELFTREELIKAFELNRIGVASAIYDPDKLLWMNGVYIRQLSLDELVERTLPFLERPEAEGGLPDSVARPLDRPFVTRVLALEHERLKTLGEAAHITSFFYTREISYETKDLLQKGMDVPRTIEALRAAHALLQELPDFSHETMEAPFRTLAEQLELKPGQLFGSVRVAVSGRKATPPLFQMLEVLGKELCLERLEGAIALLQA